MRKFFFIFVFFAILTLFSCKTRYVTVEVPVIHSELRSDTVRDSVERVDSVKIYVRGDTVYSEKYRYVTKWKDRTRTVNTTDTLTKVVEKPVTVEVEKKLTKWQNIKMNVGGVVMPLLGAIILFYGLRKWRKIKA